MSTVKMNIIKPARFLQLARSGEIILHTKDFANLWGIINANTLHTTLKRYVKKGWLYRVYRGLYAIKPINEIDPLLVGVRAMHKYTYVSTETVLVKEGLMSQVLPYITMVSSQSKRLSIGSYRYRYRQLADRYLYNPLGIKIRNGVAVATVPRAVADLLYFDPQIYIDGHKYINWKAVRQIQKQLGYPLTINYDTSSSRRRNS